MNTHFEGKYLGWWLAILLAPAALAADEVPLAPEPPMVALLAPPSMAELDSEAKGGSYLGVDVKEIDTERARALKLREESGVELTRVAEAGPAEKAGLKAGDVVLEFNGQRIDGTEQFVRLVRETPVGRTVKLLIWREGSARTVSAVIGARPVHLRSFHRRAFELPDFDVYIPDTPFPNMTWRSPRLGMLGESLEGQLAEFFGVKEGVLVRSVLKDTPAAKAGLKAGDVVLKVDNVAVTTPSEISRAIRHKTASQTFPLVVMRSHKEVTLQVMFTEDGRGSSKTPTPRSRVVRHSDGEKF